MSPQCRDLSRLRRNQRNKLFPRWLDWRVAIHRILESELASIVHKNLRAQQTLACHRQLRRPCRKPTWAVTILLLQFPLFGRKAIDFRHLGGVEPPADRRRVLMNLLRCARPRDHAAAEGL